MPQSGKKVEETYQKLTQLEHILVRPDSYVGSIEPTTDSQWVINSEDNKSAKLKVVSYTPALFKIFDELAVNAADQAQRDDTLNTIKFEISQKENKLSVYNNGVGIPVQIHEEHKIWVPELIFAHLLTSSNFDDNEKKTTGGRNGYGAKLANIYSTEFHIDIGDPESKKRYQQKCEKNMTKINKPKITKYDKNVGYVKITIFPDLKRFKLTEMTDDFINIITRRVYDIAANTPKHVKVFLNTKQIWVKNWDDYMSLYLGAKKDRFRITESPHKRWDITVSTSDIGYQQVSFVNSIATTKGGSHVDYIVGQITKKVEEMMKQKKIDVKRSYIKEHMFIGVRAVLENPSFDSQTKETCTSRYGSFGSRCELSDAFFKQFMKSDIITEAVALAKHKEYRELNKTDGKKKSVVKGLPKLDDANKAGGPESKKCTLCLTEGDSAKALIMAGLPNRDYWGAYPLRGKVLNVREATVTQLKDNAEISALKQILGLEQGKVYKSQDQLRYGGIMICTDADNDGFHIRGLIINLFAEFWPSLLELPNFISNLITPVVKATPPNRNGNMLEFYNMADYNEWRQQSTGNWKIKYYKGLGTSSSAEGKEYFRNIEKNTLPFLWSDTSLGDIELAFSKDKSNERKNWLLTTGKSFTPLDYTSKTSTYSDFVNKELVQFSLADNVRSIPSLIDGMKPSQRKVLFAFMKKNVQEEQKVARISGYVSEHTAYHHGEAALCGTIINMAQEYVGSNNINLLKPCGQFGTRVQGGKDHASARYISTMLNSCTRKLFPVSDDVMLTYLNDDGQSIEPTYYVPVLPMVLVNGSNGIGTGWRCVVPQYNPKDISENVKRHMNGLDMQPMIPWYKGFKGTIEALDDGKTYVTKGVWELKKGVREDKLIITELPINTWTQNYKEFIESIRDGTHKDKSMKINSYENHSTDTDVKFVINIPTDNIKSNQVESKYKLTSNINISNMNLFDKDNIIRKYTSPLEIIKSWYDVRKELYVGRKANQLKVLVRKINETSDMIKFMEKVMNDEIKVFRIPKQKIEQQCEQFGLKRRNGGYKYLTSIPLDSFTEEELVKLNKYYNKLKNEHKVLDGLSVYDIWKTELDQLK